MLGVEMSEETFADKIRSVNFGISRRRVPKVTRDRDSRLEAITTEHWSDRQDVELRPKTIRVKGPNMEPVDG